MEETRDLVLSETLAQQREVAKLRRVVILGFGIAAHLTALAVIVLIPLLSSELQMRPTAVATVFQLAPPPPPGQRRGLQMALQTDALSTTRPQVEPAVLQVVNDEPVKPTRSMEIPDEMLTQAVALTVGVEDGFEDGDLLNGMPGGIPGGVIGGVPGGVVGGTIGGSGTALPRFPRPDVGPRPIRTPSPSYTEEAIREKIIGEVVLRAIIDEQGKVRVLEVMRSIPELDAQAIQLVETRWRFHPATKSGRPVPTLSDLVVNFSLY